MEHPNAPRAVTRLLVSVGRSAISHVRSVFSEKRIGSAVFTSVIDVGLTEEGAVGKIKVNIDVRTPDNASTEEIRTLRAALTALDCTGDVTLVSG